MRAVNPIKLNHYRRINYTYKILIWKTWLVPNKQPICLLNYSSSRTTIWGCCIQKGVSRVRTMTRVLQLIAWGIWTGLQTLLRLSVSHLAWLLVFELASNILEIGAHGNSLRNTVILPLSNLVRLPTAIKTFGSLKFDAFKSFVQTSCDHDYDRCILETNSWRAFMISFEWTCYQGINKIFSFECPSIEVANNSFYI